MTAGTMIDLGRQPLSTAHGEFIVHHFQDHANGTLALAIIRGDPRGSTPVIARVHSACRTSEGLGACDCDCAEQLDAALAHIARVQRGALFYLMQEGRGAGFVAKALDRMLVQASGHRLTTFDAYAELGLPADPRTYGAVTAMARLLGITAPLSLLSNNPDKARALRIAGMRIAGTVPLRVAASPYSQHYLTAKTHAGHTLPARPDVASVLPPHAVPLLEPTPLAGATHLVRVAEYQLPIARTRIVWFRLTVYVDAARRAQHVVLTYGDNGGHHVLVRLQREQLLDHFRPRVPQYRARWNDAVARIVAHGRGIVVLATATEALPDEVLAPLLQAHLGHRQGVALSLAADEAADTAQLARVLAPAPARAA